MEGIYTTKDLEHFGIGSSKISRNLGTNLHRIDTGLYSNRLLTPHETLQAIQHYRPELIFTGTTAYSLYREEEPALPLSALSSTTTSRTTSQLRITRSRRDDHRIVEGLRLVSPLRAALGTDESHDRLANFISRQYQGWRGRDQFSQDLKALTAGEKSLLTPVLDLATIGASSQWERDIIRRLRDLGLDPIPNFKLGPYHWDIGFRYGSTAIDLDSNIHHGTGVSTRTFIVDRWKTNHAVRAGWGPLRYTNYCTEAAMKWLLKEIQETLAARRANPATRYGKDLPDQGIWQYHLYICR